MFQTFQLKTENTLKKEYLRNKKELLKTKNMITKMINSIESLGNEIENIFECRAKNKGNEK